MDTNSSQWVTAKLSSTVLLIASITIVFALRLTFFGSLMRGRTRCNLWTSIAKVSNCFTSRTWPTMYQLVYLQVLTLCLLIWILGIGYLLGVVRLITNLYFVRVRPLA